ncbi:hypothetical protein THRCLA_07638 [Thraustotheca clavata]|uniref:Amidohydrolase 3 domain-containing protein n=1 Tax=Thraustotheca clavata TaxID=74557 RepID=A0A1V9ZCH2_9STRA|nr:hypothetical protein THRCLA_07638 [Thraustotheca clavata]
MLVENGLIWQWTNAVDACEPREASGYVNWMKIDEKEGRIVALGSGKAPDFIRDQNEVTIDLQGKLVLPGLHDSHIHVYLIGEVAHYVDLRGTRSFEELEQRVKAHAKKYPDIEWIVGFGWEQDKLSSEARYPSRYDLDSILPDRPVYLWRVCWHISVVNSKALEIAGWKSDAILPEWKNIAGGVVDVDSNDVPTGVLREAAVNIVQKFIKEQSDESRMKYLDMGMQTCLQFGLTSKYFVVNFSNLLFGVHTNDHNAWYLYQILQDAGQVPIRIYVTPDQNEVGKSDEKYLPQPKTKCGLLSCDRVKIFSDGSLGAETAALREPYRDTTNRGVLMMSDAEMLNQIRVAKNAGYRLEVHAIGDRAAEQVLNAMEEAGLTREDRPILTHCQILGPDLIAKMSRLGVIGDIQPSFVLTDATFAEKRLPSSVVPYSYCWKSMTQAGIICAGGSDAPIETSNPFQGIYDAIHRTVPGSTNFLHNHKEMLSFAEALQMYTINGAYAAYDEHQLGQLAVGFYADFVVVNYNVDQDTSALLKPDIVHSVYVQGRKRYDGNKKVNSPVAPGLPGKNGKIRVCPCCRC